MGDEMVVFFQHMSDWSELFFFLDVAPTPSLVRFHSHSFFPSSLLCSSLHHHLLPRLYFQICFPRRASAATPLDAGRIHHVMLFIEGKQ